MKETNQNHIYLQLAEIIENKINNEVLKIGDRLPSVRVMKKEHGVSVSTVLQTYYHLESKGLIEARPQSGYYVRFSPKRFPAEPLKSRPDRQGESNAPEEIISEVFSNLSDNEKVVFSMGVPSPELIPVAKLNKSIVEAMRRLPSGGTSYETIQGNANLRRQIAKWSMIWEGNITPDDIVTTTGCMDALSLSLMAVTHRNDTIVVESPCYFGILQLAEGLGLKVIELPTDPQTGIDIDAFKKILSGKKISAVLLMSNFSNPLGCCIPPDHKKEILRLVQHFGIPLIEDDVYGDIYFSKDRPKNFKTYDDSGLVIWCSSFSKTVAPGYRVGWVAPGKYIEKIKRLKLYHEVSSATIQQEAVALFLEKGRYEYHLRRLRNTLHANNLHYVSKILDCFPEGTRVSRTSGGFFLWVELNRSIDTYRLYKEAMKSKISIAPGRMFTLRDQFHNCMRLSYGMPWNTRIENSLQTLGDIVKEMR